MDLLERGLFGLLESLSESAPFVVLGLLLAGLMREFVPTDALKKSLGGSGIAPVLRAVGLGALLPICSCSTIPLGLGMARSGAGTGTALSFMTSAPAVSPVTVALGLSLLGPALLGSYALAVLCGSIAIGLAGNSLLGEQSDAPEPKKACGCGCEQHSPNTGRRILAATRWSIFDFGSEVSTSLVVGLMLSTALLVFTPDDWVTGLIGETSLLSILTVILLSLPAYTCSVPALLIAGSLVAKGADPGLAVAFLVAGPATNLGELNSIRAGLGNRVAGFYFLAVASLAVIAAMVIGQLPLAEFSGTTATIAEAGHHGHDHLHFGTAAEETRLLEREGLAIAWWRWPFVVLVAGLAMYSALLAIYQRVEKSRDTAERQQPATRVTLEAQPLEGGTR